MNCPNCAALIHPSDSFCGQCGAQLGGALAEQDSRHAAHAAGARAYPTLPPYDAQAYPPPLPVDETEDQPFLPGSDSPPQPYGAPDYASPQPVTDRPAGYSADPGWDDAGPYREQVTDARRWLIAGVIAVLAIAAITLAGLALLKNSRSNSAGGSSSTSSAGSTSPGASAKPGSVQRPVRTVALTATASGVTYEVSIWAEDTQSNCAANAHGGPIVSFLRKHPCSGMTRRIGTTTVGGKSVGFALSVITIPSSKNAAAFRTLVTKDGTGNIDDLLSQGKRLPSGPKSVPVPDAFSTTGSGTEVIVVDSWYLSGSTPENDPPITNLARDFFGRDGVG